MIGQVSPTISESAQTPIFVVGVNGSGTSMLVESLGRHPEIYGCPGEFRLIPYLISKAEDHGDLADDNNFLSLWRHVLKSVPYFYWIYDGVIPEVPQDWSRYDRSIGAILDFEFKRLAERKGKSRWCEKSPVNLQHMVELSQEFPGAKFVHIIRDGRDSAASVNRRQHRDPALAIFRWKRILQYARKQAVKLQEGAYLEVRYEDLTADPESLMRSICEFLNVEFDSRVLESSMPESERKLSGEKGIVGKISAQEARWKSYFDESQLRDLESIAGVLLEDLGYPVVYEAGDKNLSKVKQHVTRFQDFVRSNKFLTRKLSGDRSVSWAWVFKYTLMSIREYVNKKY